MPHRADQMSTLQLMTNRRATVRALLDKPQTGASPRSNALIGRLHRLRHVVGRWWLREVWHWTR